MFPLLYCPIVKPGNGMTESMKMLTFRYVSTLIIYDSSPVNVGTDGTKLKYSKSNVEYNLKNALRGLRPQMKMTVSAICVTNSITYL